MCDVRINVRNLSVSSSSFVHYPNFECFHSIKLVLEFNGWCDQPSNFTIFNENFTHIQTSYFILLYKNLLIWHTAFCVQYLSFFLGSQIFRMCAHIRHANIAALDVTVTIIYKNLTQFFFVHTAQCGRIHI